MNPYSPPAAQDAYSAAPMMPAGMSGPTGPVSEQAVEMLRQTRPWVMLLGVLTFVFCAFMLFGGIAMIVAGFAAPERSALPAGALGVVYLPLAGVYVYPGLKMLKYAGAIGRLLQSRASIDLEEALAQQKSFWKFAGITTVVLVVVYVVVIVVAVVAGGVMAARMLHT